MFRLARPAPGRIREIPGLEWPTLADHRVGSCSAVCVPGPQRHLALAGGRIDHLPRDGVPRGGAPLATGAGCPPVGGDHRAGVWIPRRLPGV